RRAQVVGGLDHQAEQFHAAGADRLVVAGAWVVRPQPRADAANGDADLVGRFANGEVLRGTGPWGEVGLQIVVQLNALEAGVPGQLDALAQGHALRVGEGPQVDRLLHVVAARLRWFGWHVPPLVGRSLRARVCYAAGSKVEGHLHAQHQGVGELACRPG